MKLITKVKLTEDEKEVSIMFDNPKIKILGIGCYGLGGYTIWYREKKQ